MRLFERAGLLLAVCGWSFQFVFIFGCYLPASAKLKRDCSINHGIFNEATRQRPRRIWRLSRIALFLRNVIPTVKHT